MFLSHLLDLDSLPASIAESSQQILSPATPNAQDIYFCLDVHICLPHFVDDLLEFRAVLVVPVDCIPDSLLVVLGPRTGIRNFLGHLEGRCG